MSRTVRTFILMIALSCLAISASGTIPVIKVIYPRGGAHIGAADSTFVFGSVTPGSKLIINDELIDVYKNGAFIAFLPLQPGPFDFILRAINDDDTTFYIRTVLVPTPRESFGYDALSITDWKDSASNMVLADGDMLPIEFQGTPSCLVWCSIPGYDDSIPMTEMPPRVQSYWGETVFGVGAVPESLKINGYYGGFVDIDERKLPDSTRIYYFLKAPSLHDLLAIPDDSINFVDALSLLDFNGAIKTDSSGYFVSINPSDYPCMIEFTDSVQIMRVGPRKGYLAIFQPEGVHALAVGRIGDWLKLKLSQTQFGWVNVNSVTFLDPALPPTISYLRALRTFSDDSTVTINFPLSDKYPFQVTEEDRHTIKITIYGANSDTDWLRYDFKDKYVDYAYWSQPEPNLYCLTIKTNRPLWGYDCYYDGDILKLKINKPPQYHGRLDDIKIIVDPGHSPDPGAVGPTGLKESVINLEIAKAIKNDLEKHGADVILTRDDMSDLPLYDRPAIAKKENADLFISVHNNALPDGVNPFINNGTSTYYYHLHSIDLAKAIQTELLPATGLNDYGLYYGNLAVNRPTQYPAVLIECAFIILPEQEVLLKNKGFQNRVARAVRKGIMEFLDEYK
jgi:N-acetylmuramoyl-L-alanine amidase